MLLQGQLTIKICFYVMLWMLYAAMHALSMCPIVSADFTCLLADAVIHATLFAVMWLLLYPVIKYGKYENMTPVLQGLNYGTVALLTAVSMTGAGYLIDSLILNELSVAFVPTLPVKGLICLLMFALTVLLFYRRRSHAEQTGAGDALPATEPEHAEAESEIIDRITVKDRNRIHLIPACEIVYIQSYGDYVHIVTANGKYIKEKTMKYFEASLPKTFVRVHRSYIVNIEYLSRIESSGGRNQQIALKTGEWLSISLSGYKALKMTLNL